MAAVPEACGEIVGLNERWIASGMSPELALPTDDDEWFSLLKSLPNYDPFAETAIGRDMGLRFDCGRAMKGVGFFHDCLRHVKGEFKGRPFWLSRWEQAFIANLLGWVRSDGTRRYRRALVYIPRKNGKTALVAGLCLYGLVADDEDGAEIYGMASDRDQASLVFDHAKGMVQLEPELSKRLRVYKGLGQRAIAFEDVGSSYKVVDSSATGSHGWNTHLGVVDELHTQPNRELVDVLSTSTGARRQPLIVYMTTADFDRPSICNTIRDHAVNVCAGVVDDPEFLPAVYEKQPDEDWQDESVWYRVNPNLGVTPKIDYLRAAHREALADPGFEIAFRRLHLNERVEQSVAVLPLDRWDGCSGLRDGETPEAWRRRALEELRGRPCFVGMDLSSKIDMTAVVLIFRPCPGETVWRFIPYCWVPESRLRERRNGDIYAGFARGGFLSVTEGDEIDFPLIRRELNALDKVYPITEVGYDPWNATELGRQLREEDGLELVAVRQGVYSLGDPMKEVIAMAHGGRCEHGGNPVLRWAVGNLKADMDANGNMRPNKERSANKIDPFVALITGMARALASPGPKRSVYETRGLLRVTAENGT